MHRCDEECWFQMDPCCLFVVFFFFGSGFLHRMDADDCVCFLMWRQDDGSADEANVIQSHRFPKGSERTRKWLGVKQTGFTMVRPGAESWRLCDPDWSSFSCSLLCTWRGALPTGRIGFSPLADSCSFPVALFCLFTQELSPTCYLLWITSVHITKLPDTGFRWRMGRRQRGWSAATRVQTDTLTNSNKNFSFFFDNDYVH